MNLLQVHVPEELLSYTFSDFDNSTCPKKLDYLLDK